MDIERKNLEILLKEIPYDHIQLTDRPGSRRHSCDHVDRKLYLEYARRIFPSCSEDERGNQYDLLDESMWDGEQGVKSVFAMIVKLASRMLCLKGDVIKCRLNEMLRWREISFRLGQEIFTCAFLAAKDIRKGTRTRFFAWEPIIGSNDMRLDHILKRGLAENHFHLNGSTKIFELNWLCLMNHIENRGREFGKFEKILQHDYVNESEKKAFYGICQEAALYRIYLFAVLHHDRYLTENAREILLKIEKKDKTEKRNLFLWEYLSRLQDLISLAGTLYGAVNEHEVVLDYALERDTYDDNNNSCRLLSGERRFLYSCYKKALRTGSGSFSGFDRNVFYRYLVIRTYFRSEMIQVNDMVGFSNFSEYELRKEYFVEGKKEYEEELIRLAVNASFQNQNIVSLEARICPDMRSAGLAGKISRKLEVVQNDTSKDKEVGRNLFFVLHFPKQKEENYEPGMPRNAALRGRTARQANAITALFEKGDRTGAYIRGIDACANEIGCRPEVFAVSFRYLLDYCVPVRRDEAHSLMATYHAGEEFLDIVDGLRAINETLLFCGFFRGCRLGHALALGVDTKDYYTFKENRLVMPKQDLLDDMAWLLVKQEEYGCPLDGALKSTLEAKFYELFNEIYGGRFSGNAAAFHYLDYYNSWMLRGDEPSAYLTGREAFMDALTAVPLHKPDRYRFNRAVPDSIRKVDKYRELYVLYHYDRQVREAGAQKVLFRVPCGYERLVRDVQDKMIRELVDRGIGIETNPSSNYLIGTIRKYEEHPVIRFNGRKLKATETNMSLQVSINTDDQGVFDTSLENEYALMTIALKKAKDENGAYKYDMEDIYAWIDYVRRMGITQSFQMQSDVDGNIRREQWESGMGGMWQ